MWSNPDGLPFLKTGAWMFKRLILGIGAHWERINKTSMLENTYMVSKW